MLAIDDKDLGTPASVSKKLVTLEIDFHHISVPEGTSVLRAAGLAGVAIPKLCATDSMAAFGSCRLCLIEVEGRNGCPASCTTPVEAGLKGPHAEREAGKASPRRDGALRYCPTIRLTLPNARRTASANSIGWRTMWASKRFATITARALT